LTGHEYVSITYETAFPFHSDNFTEFWFLRTLDAGGHKWVRAPKASVVPVTPSANFSASGVSTYQSAASQTFKWDLSTNFAPIIGNVDTFDGASFTSSQKKEILYYENSEKDTWSDAWKDGLTLVWIDAG
jgi:hypothetical protein